MSRQKNQGGSLRRMLAALLLAGCVAAPVWAQSETSSQKKQETAHHAVHRSARHTVHHATRRTTRKTTRRTVRHTASRSRRYHHTYRRHRLTARELARSRRIRQAFVASTQLRPMAQQLAVTRSPAAYAGVRRYARTHHGEAAAAAWLALGHAYLLDHKYTDAVTALSYAHRADGVLSDYTDYLTAQAYLQNNQLPQAEDALDGFERRHPGSIFDDDVPVLEANLFLQEKDPQRALGVLHRYQGKAVAGHADFQLALAQAEQMAGNAERADALFRHVYLDYPLSSEAAAARKQLAAAGILETLPISDRRRHADALYGAGHYRDAGIDYRDLAAHLTPGSAERTALLVAAAECDLKRNRLTQRELEAIPQTGGEAGARRMYLAMELARDRGDTDQQKAIVLEMERRFPDTVWLLKALFSSGNMYLLRKDYPTAIVYYSELAKRFPWSSDAPAAHWRVAWLTYRLGNYTEAARLFDEQLRLYPGTVEASSALYWRGRIFQVQEHNPAVAAAYYEAEVRAYPHYYHAMLAAQRLKELGSVRPERIAFLDRFQPQSIPSLTDDVPENDPHVVKAKLLANAGMNEYIGAEIHRADGSAEWGAFAEARIFAADGQNWRAMRLLKRALPFYTSAPIDALPMAYWRILFPDAYWGYITKDARKNGLDPFMVASLIRQETEFNPRAVSGKDAYGLMQLLPRVGRAMARQEGIRYFRTSDLLNPRINILLGTRYLKQMLDKFDDKPEYAFAAYNAGDYRVVAWKSDGDYSGMDEFVESIPFTETRNYVQAIIRNEDFYRELHNVTRERAESRGERGVHPLVSAAGAR